jgi:putative phosphoesterase
MEFVLRKIHRSISAVAHLGDGWDDIHDLMLAYPLIPLYAVTGNCDFGSGPNSLTFNFASKRFIITHGHRFHVKSGYLRISLWAEENGADVCLFGHTHIPEVFYSGGTLMMNPGSIGLPISDAPASYGIIDVSENGLVDGTVLGKKGGAYSRMNPKE